MTVSASPSKPSLAASVRTQWRVIVALMIREGQANHSQKTLGFFWTIADPLILTCGVIVLWSMLGRAEGHKGISVFAFAASAYTHIQLWRLCVLPCLNVTHLSSWLFYHRNVHVFDVILAQALMKSVSIFASFVIVVSVATLFGLMPPVRDPGLVLAAWILDTLFCFSFAVFIAGLSGQFEIVEKIMHPLMYLTLPLTGAFTMNNWLSPRLQAILEWSPLVSCVEMFRAGMFSLSVKAYWSVPLVLICSLCFLAVGLPLTEYARRKVEAP